MKNIAFESITSSDLNHVTGGRNAFADMSTKQVVDRLQECAAEAYQRGRKDQDQGMAPEFGRDRAIAACNFGIDKVNTWEHVGRD